MEKFDAVVIGAGASGLSAAYHLLKNGRKVLLIEQADQAGGLLYSVKIGGVFLEAFYHHLFRGDTCVIEMMKELGLKNKLDWRYATTAFVFNDGVYELSKPQDILSFKIINFLEKIKFVKLMLKIKLTKNAEILDSISAKEWIIKNSDENIYYKIFQPLLKSKFGERSEEVSAAWFVDRINLRTDRNLRGERLGYIVGGFKTLIDKMVEEIKMMGGIIWLNTELQGIKVKHEKVISVKARDMEIKTDCVISTIPPHVLLKYEIFDKTFKEKIKKIEYHGALIVLLGLKKKITNFYWVNIALDSYIGAVIEHTNFQPLEVYKDHIVYLTKYPDMTSEIWNLKEEEIFEKYFSNLQRLFPHIKRSDIIWWKVFKGKNAGVIYKVGFKKEVLGHETPVKGLIVGGLFNMYPERSTHLAIKVGQDCANLAEKTIFSKNY